MVPVSLPEFNPTSRSIELVFKTLYPNMTPGELGLMFLPLVIGPILGFLSNFWQEAIYRLAHPAFEGYSWSYLTPTVVLP